MKLPKGFAILLSPRGIAPAATTWSLTKAIVVGAMGATASFGAVMMMLGAAVGEPYSNTQECLEAAFGFPEMNLLLPLGSYLFVVLVPVVLFPSDRGNLAFRAFILSHLPLVIPTVLWSFLALAREIGNPGFNLGGPGPDWVYSPIVQVGGHGFVFWALFAYGICSAVISVREVLRLEKRGELATSP